MCLSAQHDQCNDSPMTSKTSRATLQQITRIQITCRDLSANCVCAAERTGGWQLSFFKTSKPHALLVLAWPTVPLMRHVTPSLVLGREFFKGVFGGVWRINTPSLMREGVFCGRDICTRGVRTMVLAHCVPMVPFGTMIITTQQSYLPFS